MSFRPPCSQCGSTDFEEENGIIICDQGHFQEGGQRTGEDDGDYLAAGKISRRKNDKVKTKILKVHRGAKGFQLFLTAWQYILWKQCHFLVHQFGMPPDLWILVRELWILRLSKLEARIDESISLVRPESSTTVKATEVDAAVETTEKNRQVDSNPTLWDTIGLSCMGIILLRRPLHLAIIYDLIRDESICFVRAIRHVPQAIRERLAPEYHAALDTRTVPERQDLQRALYETLMMYHNTFGMQIPALNGTLMLMRYLKELSLPLEVYSGAKHIAKAAGYTFEYAIERSGRRIATTWPEAQVMAAIVVATKLLFPFDGVDVERHPYTSNEPGALSVDWTAWVEMRAAQRPRTERPAEITARRAIETVDTSVLEMNNEQLDQYMDWFQNTYITESKSMTHLQKQILDMFPLSDIQNSSTEETGDDGHVAEHSSKVDQSFIKPQLPVSDAEAERLHTGSTIVRPGERYRVHRDVEELSGPVLEFYDAAAEMACLDLKMLVRAVRHTERLLVLAQIEDRRANKYPAEEPEA